MRHRINEYKDLFASQFEVISAGSTAEPNAGKVWELWTIIAVVLGGTRLQGGYGSLWMTIGGVLTLAFELPTGAFATTVLAELVETLTPANDN